MSKKPITTQGFVLPKKPARRHVEPEEVDNFATNEIQKPSNQAAASQKGTASSKKGTRRRRNESGERISPYLPAQLVEQLLVTCAKTRMSQSQAVTEAVELWLDSRKTG